LLTLAQAIEKFNGEGAQIATFQRGLAFTEFGHDRGCILLQVFVSGRLHT
jgi:hypothetical protein